MTAHTALWILSALVGILLIQGVFDSQRIYQFPFFMAAVFAVFILPQAIALLNFPAGTNPAWVTGVSLMGFLCLLSGWAGYQMKPVRSLLFLPTVPMNDARLFHGGLVFIAVALFFNWKIGGMSVRETGGAMWTGRVTIYDFFTQLVFPGLAITLIHALKRKSTAAWLAFIIASIIPIQAAALYGRRESTVQFLITIGFVLYFYRGIKPPRWLIVALMLFLIVFIPATGTYRQVVAEEGWKSIFEIEWVDNFKTYVKKGEILELRNAAVLMEYTWETGRYQFGRDYWNQVVHRFVPAQIVGRDFKENLMFESSNRLANLWSSIDRYDKPIGATITGMGDSFVQFGWFGCLFFVLLGRLFRTFWALAHSNRGTFVQLFYILTATSAMQTVTHQTVDYLPDLLYQVLFLGLLAIYARQRKSAYSYGRRDATIE